MSDFLRNWITNITVIIIFIMFLDTIMPNNSMKRYINVIVGLLLIVVVIKPFALVDEYADSFSNEYIETASFLEQGPAKVDSTEISKYQQQKTVEIFESNLKEKLINLIENSAGEEYTGTEVDLELDRDIESKSFGSIKSVNVRLSTAQKDVIE
ncbi:MAG TPA: stage III sporulation protein AF, partial [Clostridia bacterium]|nr:stage III sporulation protein AF [Clostridia bacterium]